jgi:hypothetical protein
MTTTQRQLRRDTTANIAAITPAQGEPIYDVTRQALVLGDGATAGGLCATPFAGTWTPQLQFGGAHAGMAATAAGTWAQVGPLLFFSFSIALTAKGTSTGAATIAGLPESATAAGGHAAIDDWANLATSPAFRAYVEAAASLIHLGKSGGTSFAALADTDFTDTSQLTGFGFLFTAQPTG